MYGNGNAGLRKPALLIRRVHLKSNNMLFENSREVYWSSNMHVPECCFVGHICKIDIWGIKTRQPCRFLQGCPCINPISEDEIETGNRINNCWTKETQTKNIDLDFDMFKFFEVVVHVPVTRRFIVCSQHSATVIRELWGVPSDMHKPSTGAPRNLGLGKFVFSHEIPILSADPYPLERSSV